MLEFRGLREATFIERINRFAVMVDIDGRREIAHLHDPGRLKELLVPSARVYLRKADNPQRNTGWDVILARKGNRYVVIYSTMSNRLVRSLLEERRFPGLKSWRLERTEPRFGRGRFDFELSRKGRKMFVEVKSVSLVENKTALFPDAVTERGRRHLTELADAKKLGYETMAIFIVTRGDAESMKPHRQRDPDFAETLDLVAKKGVRMVAYNCTVTRQKMGLNMKIPIILQGQ